MGNVQFNDSKVLFGGSGVAMDSDCCCPEEVSGVCCGDSATTVPRFLQVTASGIERCSDTNEELFGNCCCDGSNNIYILEFTPLSAPQECRWFLRNDECDPELTPRFFDVEVMIQAFTLRCEDDCDSGERRWTAQIATSQTCFYGITNCTDETVDRCDFPIVLSQCDPCFTGNICVSGKNGTVTIQPI